MIYLFLAITTFSTVSRILERFALLIPHFNVGEAPRTLKFEPNPSLLKRKKKKGRSLAGRHLIQLAEDWVYVYKRVN